MEQRLIQRAGIVIIVVLIVIFTAARIPPAAGLADNPVSGLKEQENKILAELIVINQRIEAGLKEKESLESRLAASEQKAVRAKADLEVIKASLQEQTTRLGQMLSFIYRVGYVSLLDVFLSASDFDDFNNRLFLVSTIVDRYAHLRNQTDMLKNKTEDKLEEINEISALIAADRKNIQQAITLLQKAKTEQSNYLARIKSQSAELETRIILSANCWSEVNTSITGAMEKLSSLPPDQFMPDRVSLKIGGLQVEFTENTLNSKVKQGSSSAQIPISINIEPKQTVFSGTTRDTGTSFKVTGNFKITPGGREVLFVPHSFSFGETTIEGTLLSYIYQNNFLSWDITKNMPDYYAVDLVTESNKMIISLRRN